MFNRLTDFGYKRTGIQAVGFYLAYLLLVIVIAVAAGSATATATNNITFDFGFHIGNIVAIVSSLLLSFVVLSKKKLFSNFGYILLAVLSGVLAAFGGGLIGLIPAAYFSTK